MENTIMGVILSPFVGIRGDGITPLSDDICNDGFRGRFLDSTLYHDAMAPWVESPISAALGLPVKVYRSARTVNTDRVHIDSDDAPVNEHANRLFFEHDANSAEFGQPTRTFKGDVVVLRCDGENLEEMHMWAMCMHIGLAFAEEEENVPKLLTPEGFEQGFEMLREHRASKLRNLLVEYVNAFNPISGLNTMGKTKKERLAELGFSDGAQGGDAGAGEEQQEGEEAAEDSAGGKNTV